MVKTINGIKLTSENKCSFCTGSICCTYITQHIDTPRSKADFRQLLWQVSPAVMLAIFGEAGIWLRRVGRCVRKGGLRI